MAQFLIKDPAKPDDAGEVFEGTSDEVFDKIRGTGLVASDVEATREHEENPPAAE